MMPLNAITKLLKQCRIEQIVTKVKQSIEKEAEIQAK